MHRRTLYKNLPAVLLAEYSLYPFIKTPADSLVLTASYLSEDTVLPFLFSLHGDQFVLECNSFGCEQTKIFELAESLDLFAETRVAGEKTASVPSVMAYIEWLVAAWCFSVSEFRYNVRMVVADSIVRVILHSFPERNAGGKDHECCNDGT